MNTNNNGNNVSDTFEGMLFGGNTTTNSNIGTKDNRFDDSSSSLMFASKQSNTTTNNGSINQPKENGIGKILTTLHLEWSRHEIEKSKWIADKAEYEAKIAILEGRLKSYANINNELLQRIKMLESALLVARSQEKIGNESILPENTLIGEYQLPKSIYTREQSKRGRHLLQQYLKEIQIIDETIKMKNLTDSKIAEYLMKTSSDALSPQYIPNCLQSGYDSTNYSKTFGHPDPKKSHPLPMSSYESTKFLDDMKKGFKRCIDDRKRDSMSNLYNVDDDFNANKDVSSNNKASTNDNDNTTYTDSQSYDPANHLFDILQSFGSGVGNNITATTTTTTTTTNNNKNNNNNNTNVGSSSSKSGFTLNSDENMEKSVPPTTTISNEKTFLDSPPLSNNNPSGGVVRKKDHSSKKPSRMKLDMINFNEDDFCGTGFVSKKSEDQPSILNIFSKQPPQSNINMETTNNIDNEFESKLDVLAKRFNISNQESSSNTVSSVDTIDSISSNNTPIKKSVEQNDTDIDIDLGILNDIDSLISSNDDSSNILNCTNDDISTNDTSSITSMNIGKQKHWSINGVLRGHNDSITCVNMHPNKKIVASSSLDGLVYLWHYNDKRKSDMYPTWFLRGHEYPVLYCLFNTTGDFMYTSDIHGNILVWDVLNEASLLFRYQSHDEAIWHMSHNHNSNTLLAASADGVCSFWKPDSLDAIDTFNVESSSGSNQLGIISADFSPLDNSKVVIAAADSVYLYDVNAGKNIFCLQLDNNYTPTASSSSGLIQCTSLHPSNNIYATGWGHNQVKIADLISGKYITDFIAHPAPITAITFGSNTSGTYLATGGANGSIHMWSNNYSCYQDVPPHRVKHHSGVNSLSFHLSYPHMVTGGADELVKLYI